MQKGIEMNGSEVRAVATGNPAMFIKKRVLKVRERGEEKVKRERGEG